MGNEIIELDPQLLLEQSQQMNSIYGAFESLFSGLLSDLKGLNSSWSDMLSNNFTGKITAAQKSFMGSMGMIKISSDSTKSVAEAMLGISANASKYSGTFSDSSAKMSDMLSSGLAQAFNSFSTGSKAFSDGVIKDITTVSKDAREMMSNSNLAPWQEEFLKDGVKKGYETLLGEYKVLGKLTETVINGDPNEVNEVYRQLSETIGGEGVKEFAKLAAEKYGIEESEALKYAAYGINLTKDASSSITELVLDPSLEKVNKVAWNITAQPILDTAGDTIEKVIKHCPGISDYYEANGGTDLGSAAQTALGDFYGLVTGDDSMKEYASQYYENNGGVFEGMWNGVKDVVDYTKDSGGIIKGAVNYTETAVKDLKGTVENIEDVASIIHKNGGFASSVAKGFKEMFKESVDAHGVGTTN